jgi:hypothetical protein
VKIGARGVVVLTLAAALCALSLAGCGGLVNKAVEKAVEKATGDSGVSVDVDKDSGSVSISGDNGQTQIDTGSNAKIPEGFPDIALPDGSKVSQSISLGSSDGQSDMVTFKCALSGQEIYDHFLAAVPAAGFTIDNKLEFNGADGKLSQFSIWASDGTRSVVVMGGSNDTTGGGDAFSIQVVPK